MLIFSAAWKEGHYDILREKGCFSSEHIMSEAFEIVKQE